MKNSKTKKLLATIMLTSMSFNTSFVLAETGKTAHTTLEPDCLANVYQYLGPSTKMIFPMISPTCAVSTLTQTKYIPGVFC